LGETAQATFVLANLIQESKIYSILPLKKTSSNSVKNEKKHYFRNFCVKIFLFLNNFIKFMTNIFLVINLMKLFKNRKCKKLTDGGHQVMAKSHMTFGQLR
jgi:hypothetical protein